MHCAEDLSWQIYKLFGTRSGMRMTMGMVVMMMMVMKKMRMSVTHQSCSHWENDLSKVTASTWSSWPGSGFFYLLLNVL